MATALEGTESAAGSIRKVNYTHDAMIDLILARPDLSQGAIAKEFGYGQAWISRIFNSDAFQARLAARKTEVIDPSLVMTFEEKLKGLADQSLEIIAKKLEESPTLDGGLRALELSSKALGYGARQQNVAIQQNFVVALPQKAPSVEAWGSKYENVPFLSAEQVAG